MEESQEKCSRVGVVVPTAAELEPLMEFLERMTGRETAVAKYDIWQVARVQLGEVLASVILSGWGMVNAGAATEALVFSERPQFLLNYGIAGAHTRDALPGDMIIATQVCAPWSGYLRPGGVLDSAFGIQWEEEGGEGAPSPGPRRFSHLPCDSTLVALSRQAGEALVRELSWGALAPGAQPARAARVLCGTVASADTYCQDETTIERIRGAFGSLCEDMESAAVGHIAARHGLPFAVIRCLSNNDLVEVLTAEQKRARYPEMMRRAALVIARVLQELSTRAREAEQAPEAPPPE